MICWYIVPFLWWVYKKYIRKEAGEEGESTNELTEKPLEAPIPSALIEEPQMIQQPVILQSPTQPNIQYVDQFGNPVAPNPQSPQQIHVQQPVQQIQPMMVQQPFKNQAYPQQLNGQQP